MIGLRIVQKKDMPLGSRPLRRGSVGNDVRQAEGILKHLGIYRENEDGRFGFLMEDAVINLQRALFLPVNGRIDHNFLQSLAGNAGKGCSVYRAAPGETDEEVAEKFGISKEALRNRDKARAVKARERFLFVPRKKLWIWESEKKTSFNYSGLLYQGNRDRSVPLEEGTAEHRVYRLEELKPESGTDKNSVPSENWILDLRSEEPLSIRRAIQRYSRTGAGWFWLKDEILMIPGMIYYLKLDQLGKQKGIIIELNPTLDKKARTRTKKEFTPRIVGSIRLPIIYSMNLSPRVLIDQDQRMISQKESRLWHYRRVDKSRYQEGLIRWAVFPVSFEGKTGWVLQMDQETIRSLYRLVLTTGCAGVLLEGTKGADSRFVNLRRDYFALENIGHEMSVRDIYLKREKMPGLSGRHGAADGRQGKDGERRRAFNGRDG